MRKYILVSLLLLSTMVYAVSSVEVSQNLNDLMSKINQVNQDLTQKQRQQKNLDNAIADSNQAISQSVLLLNQLKQQRNLDIGELKEISTVLPQMESATLDAEKNVKAAITTIYQQIKEIQFESNSIISGNDVTQKKRKQIYLIDLLHAEAVKYQNLQTKLQQLTSLNNKLNLEVDRLGSQLGITSKQKEQLQQETESQIQQDARLHSMIIKEQQQLQGLKQKQVLLNRLMATLSATPETSQLNTKSTVKTSKKEGNKEANTAADDMGDLFGQQLAKPINANIAIPYGALRHGIKNNGVLYKATNTPVFSIAAGKVVYAGGLPGFGQVVVINHGNGYMSVYGGIVPSMQKGAMVSTGQVIGSAGVEANQPMGGVYFELRHLGQPINPDDLVN